MQIEDNRKRTDWQPRQDLPDAWGQKVSCPLCGTHPINIVHLQGSSDYMLCPGCELSFEVEQHNGYIRLKNIPEQLGFAETGLQHNWVLPQILKELAQDKEKYIQDRNSSGTPLSDDEVWERMLGLYRLGNKPGLIELIMIQSGCSKEQAKKAGQKLREYIEGETRRQNQRLLLIGVVTLILVIGVIIGGLLFANQQISTQLSEGKKGSGLVQTANMSLKLLNSLPDAVKPEFLKGPSAYVDYSGPNPAMCPGRAQDAARLFGGDEGGWQAGNQAGSWQMISTGKPVTIQIPRGMYAGYIDNKTFVFKQADGPATIHYVNFVVISCQ
ncbi:MAG: hypothetical protein WCP19_09705 [Chloroflexota bacterium]